MKYIAYLLILLLPIILFSAIVEIHVNGYYTSFLDTDKKIPILTYYTISHHALSTRKVNRYTTWRQYPMFEKYQSKRTDYSHTPYDRGHYIPANDMKFSKNAQKSTFYYINCAPQRDSLNRKIWRKIEKYIHNKGLKSDSMTVYTFALTYGAIKRIGNEVAVPNSFIKIAIFYSDTITDTISYECYNRIPKYKDISKYEIPNDFAIQMLNMIYNDIRYYKGE